MNRSPAILAIDTTSEYGNVVLWRWHSVAAEVRLHSTDGFGHLIMQGIEDSLRQADARLEEIDCFASAIGPGSFTGVRVGLSAVKALAEATHKPAAGISNLRALSLSGKSALRAVVLDARRGKVYGAVYNAAGRVVVPEIVAPWDEWLKTVPTDAEFIGWENGPCHTADVTFTAASHWLAISIAKCAEMDGADRWYDPGALDANYVRRSDAELFWKDA